MELLPFLPALLLGAILAATDPIAAIAVFRRLEVPLELATIVEGESLFNDGAAIVLYGVVIELLAGARAAPTPLGIAWTAISVAAFGALIGLVVAAVVARLLRGIADAQLQVVGTIVAAFGSYLLADDFHFSGIFAAVVAGIALRAFPRFPSRDASIDVDRFRSVVSFLANALRGALSVAIVIGLPKDIPYGHQLVDTVFGVVFVTLVARGLGVGPLTSRVNLAHA